MQAPHYAFGGRIGVIVLDKLALDPVFGIQLAPVGFHEKPARIAMSRRFHKDNARQGVHADKFSHSVVPERTSVFAIPDRHRIPIPYECLQGRAYQNQLPVCLS